MLIALKILHVLSSLFIVLLVLVQTKGGGLSSTFGSSINMYRSRRGLEKGILYLTVFFSIVITVSSLLMISLS